MWELFMLLFIPQVIGTTCIEKSGLIGSYRPQCLERGLWRPKQCWGSVGMCWCVHTETGQKLTTPSHPWEMEINC